ncbi:hydrogenase subunit MbhD domain-containing protein [Streptomyces longisporoflavus]|uniref:Hydrogenase subunit MbhD domain-containing protein n=1 Tax=Streptomyces longisporoflavus TaxID=28044 RepID=A0ABW7QF70_9ACTN
MGSDPIISLCLVLVAASVTVAVAVREPAGQALVLAVLGLALAALFTVLQTPDAVLSQLAVGSVVTPLMILLSVRKARRREHPADGDGDRVER